MTRSPFLAWAAALACLLTVSPAPADDRPSLLFIIADDWGYPHAGAYGDKVVQTPNFDRLAREGVLFTNAYCVSPSCTPSRGAILTGRPIHQLESGGNLWSALPARFRCYPDLLEEAGYRVGLTGKGWGPGSLEGTGRTRNPAGPAGRSFAEFLRGVPEGTPFCDWYGSTDPHRPYEPGSGRAAGKSLEAVEVPPYWPDTPEVRSDILDYYHEVERFDRQVGTLLEELARSGRDGNTIVVVTSDNGMPFPRCKANLYGAGTRLPLVVRWPGKARAGLVVQDFVSFTDLAPTFLDAAGLTPPAEMTGRSLLPLLRGEPAEGRDAVFLERERHANVRRGNLSYPCRAVRTHDYLYIQNLRPDRWPAGDPERYFAVGDYGDIDNGPTKSAVLATRDNPEQSRAYRLAMAKRPAEELYDLRRDPHELLNVADDPAHAEALQALRERLNTWRKQTADPLLTSGEDDPFDHYRYFGGPAGPQDR